MSYELKPAASLEFKKEHVLQLIRGFEGLDALLERYGVQDWSFTDGTDDGTRIRAFGPKDRMQALKYDLERL